MATATSALQAHPAPRRSALSVYTKVVVGLVLGLIFMGALVTSNNAGLSVPDWPTSYGQNMFLFPPSQWIGPIFYEHVHRLLASGVGFSILILAVCLYRSEPRRWVRLLGYAALVAVMVQGLLGGLTVLLQLPLAVSSLHGVLAQTILVLTCCIAYTQSTEGFLRGRVRETSTVMMTIFPRALLLMACLYLQLILGAIMRHAEAGLAIADFPTIAGGWLPWATSEVVTQANEIRKNMGLIPVDTTQIVLHLLHRSWGMILLPLGGILLVQIVSRASGLGAELAAVRRSALSIGALLVAQFCLGVITVLSVRNPWITSLHVALGAATLLATTLLALRAYPWPQKVWPDNRS